MQRIATYIGFAIKSNHIIKGLDDILKSRKRVELIIVSATLKENSCEKIKKYLSDHGISNIVVGDEIFSKLNIDGVKVLGITDKNLAMAIEKEYIIITNQ